MPPVAEPHAPVAEPHAPVAEPPCPRGGAAHVTVPRLTGALRVPHGAPWGYERAGRAPHRAGSGCRCRRPGHRLLRSAVRGPRGAGGVGAGGRRAGRSACPTGRCRAAGAGSRRSRRDAPGLRGAAGSRLAHDRTRARWGRRSVAGADQGGAQCGGRGDSGAGRGAVRLVLDRTRGRAPVDDPALVETVLDATAPEAARLHAARGLGLGLEITASARALAPFDGRPRIVTGRAATELPAGRVGVGPAVPVLDLPRSWADARTALRFTAQGTAQDPGPTIVYADELGGVALWPTSSRRVPSRRPTSVRWRRRGRPRPGCSARCTPWSRRRACVRLPPRSTSTTPPCRTGCPTRSICWAGRCAHLRADCGCN